MKKIFINNLVGGIAAALGGLVVNGAVKYFGNPVNRAKIKNRVVRIKTKFKIKKLRVVD